MCIRDRYRETTKCHTIKEKDPSLVGKEWAALSPVNLTSLGAATYNQLFNRQVLPPPSAVLPALRFLSEVAHASAKCRA